MNKAPSYQKLFLIDTCSCTTHWELLWKAASWTVQSTSWRRKQMEAARTSKWSHVVPSLQIQAANDESLNEIRSLWIFLSPKLCSKDAKGNPKCSPKRRDCLVNRPDKGSSILLYSSVEQSQARHCQPLVINPHKAFRKEFSAFNISEVSQTRYREIKWKHYVSFNNLHLSDPVCIIVSLPKWTWGRSNW